MGKWLALILMIVDHLAIVIQDKIPPEAYITMRALGRISYPLFAYYIVMGAKRTSNSLGYFKRIAIFAIITELVRHQFDVFKIEDLNVLFGFCLFVLMYELLNRKEKKVSYYVLLAVVLYVFQFIEYGYFGAVLMLSIVIIDRLEIDPQWKSLLAVAGILIIGFIFSSKFQMIALISGFFMFSPILDKRLFNAKFEKWTFYLFYPIQFAILGLIYEIFIN